MSYFVTGATGFIGRHLVEELLDHREGTIFVLVRQGSLPRLQTMIELRDTDRVVPVVGDLGADGLGVDEAWIGDHVGDIDHGRRRCQPDHERRRHPSCARAR